MYRTILWSPTNLKKMMDTVHQAAEGESVEFVDPYTLMLCRWTRGFGRPARDLPHLGPYLRRMLARPAVQRALATEKLTDPLI